MTRQMWLWARRRSWAHTLEQKKSEAKKRIGSYRTAGLEGSIDVAVRRWGLLPARAGGGVGQGAWGGGLVEGLSGRSGPREPPGQVRVAPRMPMELGDILKLTVLLLAVPAQLWLSSE